MVRVLSLVAGLLVMLSAFSLRAANCLARTNSPTLNLPATLSTSGYLTEAVFHGVSFSWPVSIAAPVGETNRLFIAEKDGYISLITNLAAPTRTVFLDISDIVSRDTKEDGLLGMALHPGFATNGYVFVFYNTPTNGTKWDCIARFQVDPQNTNHAVRTSHTVILFQNDPTINHNAGDLHFGPDGYLYASMGDPNYTSQQIYDLHSGMLRIDVDKKPGNRLPNPVNGTTTNYFVPNDNPYLNATTLNGESIVTNYVRTEFYAIGLRNPWRFSFDSLTGDLYVGDVGLWSAEEVDIVQKGKNYGWGFAEGNYISEQAYAPYLTPPLYQYDHEKGLAIIGGTVYRGGQIPDLYGCYVFADYASGTIWSLRYEDGQATNVRELCNYPAIICFGTDPRNGDILLASADGTLRRIAKTSVPEGISIPVLLSQTGAFSDLETLTTVPGIIPYDINVSFWSDYAQKHRWFMVPSGQQIGFERDDNWHFPVGTTWIKHFDMEMVRGNPATKRRIETRFLVLTADGAYGLSYAWNAAQTDASLVSAGGMTTELAVTNNGVPQSQQWMFPSRSQCLTCHTRHSEFALGFTTRQLNRDVSCGGGVVNQIQAMSDAGYFTAPVTNQHLLPSLADAADSNSSLEFRARSYLAVNCANCHQRFGWGFGNWDARLSTQFSSAGLITPELNDYSYIDQMIIPGQPVESMILQRMQGIGGQRMPPLGSTVIDQTGIDLVTRWVNSLVNRQSFADWQIAQSVTNVTSFADSDGDGAPNYHEYLAGTNPRNAASIWKSTVSKFSDHVELSFNIISNRIYEVQWSTNLLSGWQPLDHPGNAPNPKAGDGVLTLDLGAPVNLNKFYRVEVRDP